MLIWVRIVMSCGRGLAGHFVGWIIQAERLGCGLQMLIFWVSFCHELWARFYRNVFCRMNPLGERLDCGSQMLYGRDFAGKFFTPFFKSMYAVFAVRFHFVERILLWKSRAWFYVLRNIIWQLVLWLIVEHLPPGVNHCVNLMRCCVHIYSLFMF